MDYAGLLKEFKGYEGWGQAEALADYAKTGGAGKERRNASVGGVGGYQAPQAPQYNMPVQQTPYYQAPTQYKLPEQTPIDYNAIIKQAQEMATQAVQPLISQYQSQIPEAQTRYDQLIKDITRTGTLATAQEMSRRGIPTQSGLYEQQLAQRTEPLIAQAGQARSSELAGINQAMANLQSGAQQSGLSAGLNLYGTQVGQQQSQASNALQLMGLNANSEQNAVSNALQMMGLNQSAANSAADQLLQQAQLEQQNQQFNAQQDWQQKVYQETTLPESRASIANTQSLISDRASSGGGAKTSPTAKAAIDYLSSQGAGTGLSFMSKSDIWNYIHNLELQNPGINFDAVWALYNATPEDQVAATPERKKFLGIF